MEDARYDPELGYAVIESLLSAEDVGAVLASCDALFVVVPEERHARDRVAQGTRHLEALDERCEPVQEVVSRAALVDAVVAVVGESFTSETVSLRSPQPGFGGQKLHTDDVPKLDSGPDLVATAIVALTDFTESNGATRIVPGSHRRPDLQRLAGSMDSHPDEVVLTGPAGTAFVFSGHLLHSGSPNRSTGERPALQLTWRRT